MKTYDEAVALCQQGGMRLCASTVELDRSCNSGCNYNRALVWTSQVHESGTNVYHVQMPRPMPDCQTPRCQCGPSQTSARSAEVAQIREPFRRGMCGCFDGGRLGSSVPTCRRFTIPHCTAHRKIQGCNKVALKCLLPFRSP